MINHVKQTTLFDALTAEGLRKSASYKNRMGSIFREPKEVLGSKFSIIVNVIVNTQSCMIQVMEILLFHISREQNLFAPDPLNDYTPSSLFVTEFKSHRKLFSVFDGYLNS